MSHTIHRIEVPITDETRKTIQGFESPLHIATSRFNFNELELWYEVSDNILDTEVVVHVVGTGNPIPRMGMGWYSTFVGTCITHGGDLVWHTWVSWRKVAQ